MAETDRQRRKLWRRCRRIAATVSLPTPFEVTTFTAALSQRLGRPVELLPLPIRSAGPCGVLVSTDRAEYIGYPADTALLHQQHIVLHEVGHLLCGHQGTEVLGQAARENLLPHLSDELIHRVLGRSGYTDAQEREAELFASLVLNRVARHRPVLPPTTPAGALARFGLLFDLAPETVSAEAAGPRALTAEAAAPESAAPEPGGPRA